MIKIQEYIKDSGGGCWTERKVSFKDRNFEGNKNIEINSNYFLFSPFLLLDFLLFELFTGENNLVIGCTLDWCFAKKETEGAGGEAEGDRRSVSSS